MKFLKVRGFDGEEVFGVELKVRLKNIKQINDEFDCSCGNLYSRRVGMLKFLYVFEHEQDAKDFSITAAINGFINNDQ